MIQLHGRDGSQEKGEHRSWNGIIMLISKGRNEVQEGLLGKLSLTQHGLFGARKEIWMFRYIYYLNFQY